MLCGRGQYLLMADADGATQISDLDFLFDKLKAAEKNGLGVAVGSRAHLEQRAVATVCSSQSFRLTYIFISVNGTETLPCTFSTLSFGYLVFVQSRTPNVDSNCFLGKPVDGFSGTSASMAGHLMPNYC
jgi:hypothetical protein